MSNLLYVTVWFHHYYPNTVMKHCFGRLNFIGLDLQKKVYDLIFQTLKIRFPTYENLYNCLFEKYRNEGIVTDNVVLFVENLCAISEDEENQFKQNLVSRNRDKRKYRQNETNHEIKMNFHYLPKVCKFQTKEETDPKM